MKLRKYSHVFALLFIPMIYKADFYKPLDVLIVLSDASDMKALRPVEKKLKQAGVNYKVFSLGKAASFYKGRSSELVIPRLDVYSQRYDFMKNREKPLTKSQLNLLTISVNPKVVISGVSSHVQAQILNSFKKKGAATIAYYDNFDGPDTKEYAHAFLKELGDVDEFMVPSELTAASFEDLGKKHNAKVKVMGHPSLESWERIFAQTDREILRKEMGFSSKDKIIYQAGDYGFEYEKQFKKFIKAAKKLKKYKFIITYHPKTDGKFEVKEVSESGAQNIFLVKKGTHSAPAVAKISDAVVARKSSLGVKALYMDKPVIFFASNDYTNFAIEKGLSRKVSSPDALVRVLKNTVSRKQASIAVSKTFGVPGNASTKISEHLVALVKENSQKS